MKGLKIEKIKLEKVDKRGKVYEFFNLPTKKLVLVDRVKGSFSGQHYHKGKIKMKNPEVVILCKGKVELYLKNLKTGGEKRVIVSAPRIVKIYPFIYHEAKALSDIILLEFNSLKEHKKDTVKSIRLIK